MSEPFVSDNDVTLYVGDCLEVLRGISDYRIDAVVTSPPYLDTRPEYPSPTVEEFGAIFRELERVCMGAMLWNVGRGAASSGDKT